MPEILVPKTEKELLEFRERVKKGELEEFVGAYDEPTFIIKSKGDMSPYERQAMEDWRNRETKKLIDRVKKLKIQTV